jgi:hypothetical protein
VDSGAAPKAAGDNSSGSSGGGGEGGGSGGSSGATTDNTESTQKPLHAQAAYRSHRHLPKNIGRNTSKSTLQAITFAEEDHDDVTRQCTSELETRLNEITGEEIKAATSLMRKMRKKCDWYHLAIKQKNEILKDLQKQILRLQQKTDRKDGHRGALRRRAEVLRKTLTELTTKYSTQQMNLKIYGHMSKRLMRQVKTTDKSMMHVQQELSLVSKRHKEMEHLHRKLANRKANLYKTRAHLRAKLKDYQDRRTQALLKIERVIQESQLESQLIKDKVRDNENNRQGGSRTDRMAQLYSKHKAKNAQMPKEFREQTQRMQRLEEAFMRIRNSTGLSDVNEIVSKFLSRDEKYEALCNQADEARQKIEKLKVEKIEVQTAIAEFQGSAKGRSTGNRDLYREVDLYDQKLTEAQRKHQKQREKSTRVRLLLEESRITVGRFLKTLSNFGTSSLSMNDDPTRFVPSISSLPKALQNVKSQVAVMLEQLAVLLAADSDAGSSRPGTHNNRGGSGGGGSGSTFLTQSPIVSRTQVEAQRKRSTRLSKSPDEKEAEEAKEGSGGRGEEGKQSEDGDAKDAEGGGDKHEGGDESVPDEDESDDESMARPVPHMATVLCNPRADKLIFQSLMATAPDISGQNMRIARDKSTNARESAVAHLLGLELGPSGGGGGGSGGGGGEPDMSGEANRIDEADELRDPRGWDAHKKRGQATLDRDRIKHLSRSLVEKRKRRDFREHAAREAAADAIESDDGGGGSGDDDLNW